MTKLDRITTRNLTLDSLRKRGFDESYYDHSRKVHRVVCGQCRAACINGVATHEQGCPNITRQKSNG